MSRVNVREVFGMIQFALILDLVRSAFPISMNDK